ncbi:hypothetical protein M9H77_13136 [Catharanthus roseus]|uniref:Uncharacterized protein n=1 Tax=Catharanthus roseus TaxID=4058 RepID=A0ACC0BJC6_CATRO|nr:hypothetical protein M9H77_13136 [Catharanthus roseus]
MRVSSAAGKSEQIKTHQRSFYALNLKEHVMQQWGSTDKTLGAPTRSALGPPQFRASLDSPLGDRPTAEHDAMSTEIPVRPRPQGTMPLFKWIHPQSKKPVHVIGRGPRMGD